MERNINKGKILKSGTKVIKFAVLKERLSYKRFMKKINHLLKLLQSTIDDLQNFRSQLVEFSRDKVVIKTPKTIISSYCLKCRLSRSISKRNLPTKCCSIGRLQNRKFKCGDFIRRGDVTGI